MAHDNKLNECKQSWKDKLSCQPFSVALSLFFFLFQWVCMDKLESKTGKDLIPNHSCRTDNYLQNLVSPCSLLELKCHLIPNHSTSGLMHVSYTGGVKWCLWCSIKWSLHRLFNGSQRCHKSTTQQFNCVLLF